MYPSSVTFFKWHHYWNDQLVPASIKGAPFLVRILVLSQLAALCIYKKVKNKIEKMIMAAHKFYCELIFLSTTPLSPPTFCLSVLKVDKVKPKRKRMAPYPKDSSSNPKLKLWSPVIPCDTFPQLFKFLFFLKLYLFFSFLSFYFKSKMPRTKLLPHSHPD